MLIQIVDNQNFNSKCNLLNAKYKSYLKQLRLQTTLENINVLDFCFQLKVKVGQEANFYPLVALLRKFLRKVLRD